MSKQPTKAPNREQVAKWAQEAGFTVRNEIIKSVHSNGSWVAVSERLAEFAALAYAAGQTGEREACAALHDSEGVLAPVGQSAWGEAYQDGWIAGVSAYREAIRARGANESIN